MKKNKLLKIILIGMILFFIIGILYISIVSKSNRTLIKDNFNLFLLDIGKNKLNTGVSFKNSIINGFSTIILIFISGLSIVGLPAIVSVLFFKSFLIGFNISSILYLYGFKGVFLMIIYIIPSLINLFIYLVLGYSGIRISVLLFKKLFKHKDISFNKIINKYLIIMGLSTLVIILSSILEIYLIPILIRLLQIK